MYVNKNPSTATKRKKQNKPKPTNPQNLCTLTIITHIIISVIVPLHKSPYAYSNMDLHLNS